MTEKEFQDDLAQAIKWATVGIDPEVPIRYFSGFIDGKLYQSIHGKTVWTRKNDVSTSFRQTTLFRVLEDRAEELCIEMHPDWFEPKKEGFYYRLDRPWVKHSKHSDKKNFVEKFIQDWKKNHFEVREISKISASAI